MGGYAVLGANGKHTQVFNSDFKDFKPARRLTDGWVGNGKCCIYCRRKLDTPGWVPRFSTHFGSISLIIKKIKTFLNSLILHIRPPHLNNE